MGNKGYKSNDFDNLMIFSKNIPSLKLALPTGKWMVIWLVDNPSLPFWGPKSLFDYLG